MVAQNSLTIFIILIVIVYVTNTIMKIGTTKLKMFEIVDYQFKILSLIFSSGNPNSAPIDERGKKNCDFRIEIDVQK